MQNSIQIDLDRTLGAIDRNLFGGFAEHLGRCIYGGVYEPGSPLAGEDGFRRDVLEALRRLKMPLIRYPGGNFVSGYRWRDGVGPKAERQARAELAWNSTEPNTFGTNEFVDFCRKLGTEPYLAVNCGDGDMREARDWVEYCNGTQDTALVKLRKSHGYEAPHQVKYWGIGNEVDGHWQIGHKTPQEYARAYTEFGKVMRWVDPSIKLLASANSSWAPDWVERAQLLMEQAGDLVDYMAIHWYVGNREKDFARYMALSEEFEARLSATEGIIKAMTLARGLKRRPAVAVDEWNVWYRAGGEEGLEEVYNLEDALVVALQMNAFLRHADGVKMANLAQIVNVIAPVMTSPQGLVLQTIFHPFELYSQRCGTVSLDASWKGDTFDGGSHTGLRVLDVAASLNPETREVALFIVNRSKGQGIEAEVKLAEGSFRGPAKVAVVNGPDVEAANTFDTPEAVGTRESEVAAEGRGLVLQLEPHSVTVVTCGIG